MSEFYRNLVLHYDSIFPMEPVIRDFLAAAMPMPGPVLDVACGTGSYALALSGLGFDMSGVELDQDMLEKARAKAGAASCRFIVADMRRLDFAVDGEFRGLYCVGNSIVHLAGRDELALSLAEFRRVLAPGGALLVQIVNFDRLRRAEERGGLPEIRRAGPPAIRFIRRYLPLDAGRVWFDTELHVEQPAGGKVNRQRLSLLALESSELSGLVRAAGFDSIELCGDYGGAAFDPAASMLCILKARRPA
jgi:glycine/sarcosine N-methyltransferase